LKIFFMISSSSILRDTGILSFFRNISGK